MNKIHDIESHTEQICRNLEKLGFVDFLLKNEDCALKRILLSHDIGGVDIINIDLNMNFVEIISKRPGGEIELRAAIRKPNSAHRCLEI